ncbi:MAG: hypothetical protein Q8M99_09585 [Methylotenera sp.]|nr:hypothetical protein [Methylotenera sp.]
MNIRQLVLVLMLLVTAQQVLAAPQLILSVNEKEGLPEINYGGMRILTADFIFFGNNWAWAHQQINLKTEAPFKYSIQGKNQTLGFNLEAGINKTSDNSMRWDYTLNANEQINNVVGGGISFKFNADNLMMQTMGQPEILADKSGWRWGQGDKSFEMRFTPKPAELFFEGGGKTELRAYFYSGSITKGAKSYQATITTSDKISIRPTTSERFGFDNKNSWQKDNVDWKYSPVDLSFLNDNEKPAGKRGFVKAQGENLIFEDGTRAKFWGTNLSAYTLFHTSKENVKIQAKRLSALGFNLARLHHHDSPWVTPNIFGNNPKNTLSLNGDSLDKLDWWIKCLKDEGIYVWLDMHVERAITKDDGIYAFDEISKGKPQATLKGYNYVNLTIQNAMKTFNTQYLQHVNSYTKTAYIHEPAVLAILITNENDITHHFGNALLPDKKVPKHSQLYMREAEVFAKQNNLSVNKTWRSWEHGPSKIFLNDLEQRFHQESITQLKAISAKSLIVPTNTWGGNPVSSLPSLTVGDMIDVHAYQGYGAIESNPTITANLTHWIAAGQIISKPLSVTEWNAEPFPTHDRHTLPMYVAAQASHQGWDAMMQYAYAQIPLNDASRPSNWETFNDPSYISTLPASALMYRQGHISESKSLYVFSPSKDDLFNENINANSSAAIRTASELGKVQIAMPAVPELPWLKTSVIPSQAKLIKDYKTSLIGQNVGEATSDSGELTRNWDKGFYQINTPKTQAVMGWIGAKKFTLDDVEFEITTANATASVQSLDDKKINQSSNILISLASRALPDSGNKSLYRFQPALGRISIKAPIGLNLYKNGILKQKIQLKPEYSNGRYLINVKDSTNSNWLILTNKNKSL